MYLSTSEGCLFFDEDSDMLRKQHIFTFMAKMMNTDKIRMVRITPTTTAIAISISGDKCSVTKKKLGHKTSL